MAAPHNLSSGQDHRDALAGVMPDDALYEILLHLPAKDLCRLRTVCQPWLSLLSSRHFIAAHAARHPEPLIVLGYRAPWYGSLLYEIMDLSSRVVKRVHSTGDGVEPERVMCSHLDLMCVVKGSGMSCRLLNPTTGAVHYALPEGLAPEHAEYGKKDCRASTTFGLVPSTGEYKVLRSVRTYTDDGFSRRTEHVELYEVFDLGDSSSQARWRGIQAPPYDIEFGNPYSVVIGGIVYFLLLDDFYWYNDVNRDLVASFDLEMEKWSASIRGPSGIFAAADDNARNWYGAYWPCFRIAALSGCLVFGSRTPSSSMDSPSMDLWFLRDFEKGLWVKQHSIRISILHAQHLMQSVLVLTDGRSIVDDVGNWAFLKIYKGDIDRTSGVVENYCVEVGLYGGSLLSLTSGSS